MRIATEAGLLPVSGLAPGERSPGHAQFGRRRVAGVIRP